MATMIEDGDYIDRQRDRAEVLRQASTEFDVYNIIESLQEENKKLTAELAREKHNRQCAEDLASVLQGEIDHYSTEAHIRD